MKTCVKSLALLAAAGALLLSAGANAQSGDELLKAKGCLGCHDMEKKKVGPAFKDVAAKKKGKSAELVAKLKDAKGHPKVNATEAEIKSVVEAVLSKK